VNLIKKYVLTVVCLLLTESLCAQKFRNGITEIGFLLGGGNYFGDLAPEIVLKETNPAIGLFYKKHHSKYFSSRYQFLYTSISGDDKNFKANSYRSLSFHSNIFELGYSLEFNFIGFGINNNQHEKPYTTYVFGGFNMFTFNPKAYLPSGDEVELRNIGTEGQVLENKKKYSLIQPALNFGIGYKFNIKNYTVIGIELGFRKTFTDYLDDVKGTYPDFAALNAKQGTGAGDFSQPQTVNGNPPFPAGTMRGDPHLKDWYMVAGITISFRSYKRTPCYGFGN
jgi:hypothetical protein